MSDQTKLSEGKIWMCKTELELAFEPYSDLAVGKILKN